MVQFNVQLSSSLLCAAAPSESMWHGVSVWGGGAQKAQESLFKQIVAVTYLFTYPFVGHLAVSDLLGPMPLMSLEPWGMCEWENKDRIFACASATKICSFHSQSWSSPKLPTTIPAVCSSQPQSAWWRHISHHCNVNLRQWITGSAAIGPQRAGTQVYHLWFFITLFFVYVGFIIPAACLLYNFL